MMHRFVGTLDERKKTERGFPSKLRLNIEDLSSSSADILTPIDQEQTQLKVLCCNNWRRLQHIFHCVLDSITKRNEKLRSNLVPLERASRY